MAVGEPDEEIAQIGIGLDAVHLAGADQAGEAGPITTALIVPRKKCVSTVHGRAADSVLDQIGIDVDAAIVKEEPEAFFPAQHIRHGLPEF